MFRPASHSRLIDAAPKTLSIVDIEPNEPRQMRVWLKLWQEVKKIEQDLVEKWCVDSEHKQLYMICVAGEPSAGTHTKI